MVAVIVGVAVVVLVVIVFFALRSAQNEPEPDAPFAPPPAQPIKAAPMRVMQMHTVGLVRITDDQGERVEKLWGAIFPGTFGGWERRSSKEKLGAMVREAVALSLAAVADHLKLSEAARPQGCAWVG